MARSKGIEETISLLSDEEWKWVVCAASIEWAKKIIKFCLFGVFIVTLLFHPQNQAWCFARDMYIYKYYTYLEKLFTTLCALYSKSEQSRREQTRRRAFAHITPSRRCCFPLFAKANGSFSPDTSMSIVNSHSIYTRKAKIVPFCNFVLVALCSR